ncbi:hypothetical protein HK098_005832 [Nowakowskiella sp. JEL0407]|nr:hypothetical protein HK098_005832 [Nowakowskiella sp. JEL0407]
MSNTVWTHPSSSLVSTTWLSQNLPHVKILDGSWHLPSLNRSAISEFTNCRIPSAQFFDIDDVSDKSVSLPHMLPSPELFASKVGSLGVSETDHVVIYDSAGIGPACRVYWTFKVFGHLKVSVLDGGLPRWLNDGHPVESGPFSTEPKVYKTPEINQSLVKTYTDMKDILQSKSEQILDARPSRRFHGIDPEPRPGLPSGHMPGSINVPFMELSDPTTKRLLPIENLREYFHNKRIDLEKPIANTCGSGVTASIVYFALEQAGATQLSVYDGSWSEYASISESQIEERGPK